MFKRRVAFALLLSILVTYKCAEAQNMPSKEQMQAMLPMINEKLRANPNDWESLMQRSFISESMGNLKAAIADLTRAIEVEPARKKMALVRRCCVYGRHKDNAHALADANSVIALGPDAVGYSNRGVIYLAMNQLDNSTRDFSAAAKLDPRFAAAWEGLGEVSYKTRQYQKAKEYFDAALRLNPQMLDALYYRGKSLQALGKQEQGSKDVDKALAAGFKEEQLQTIYKDSR